MSDDSMEIIDEYDYAGLNENIHLTKGFNKIMVEWNEDSNNIEIRRVLD
ncbi:hypothetical protein [uncultured Methanobrevibacter sp.]|nr:hypothetical protein [uncultured Methanobrevibacter sp.]